MVKRIVSRDDPKKAKKMMDTIQAPCLRAKTGTLVAARERVLLRARLRARVHVATRLHLVVHPFQSGMVKPSLVCISLDLAWFALHRSALFYCAS